MAIFHALAPARPAHSVNRRSAPVHVRTRASLRSAPSPARHRGHAAPRASPRRATDQGVEAPAVGDVMSTPPLTVSESETVLDAAKKLLAARIHGLPVVNEEQELIGIFTESDVLETAALLHSESYSVSPASRTLLDLYRQWDEAKPRFDEVMSMKLRHAMTQGRDTLCLAPSDTLHAAAVMLEYGPAWAEMDPSGERWGSGHQTIPVVGEGGRVVGVVTKGDILRCHALDLWSESTEEIEGPDAAF